MADWIGYALAVAAFLVLAPFAALFGKRHARNIKGGLAIVMLGIGWPLDPPQKHIIEAQGGEEEPPAPTGEPKETA